MKKNIVQLFCRLALLLTSFVLIACGGQAVKDTPVGTPLLIDSKAQVKSKDEKNNVQIEIAMQPGRAIRMEVTALLGYRVASVVMTPQQIQYALHTQKKYVQGAFSAKTIYPIFNQFIDPRILWKVIHGQNPQSTNLICQLDPQGRPTSCQGPQQLVVQWTYEEPPQKKIEIRNNQFEMIWIFKGQAVLKQSQDEIAETFVLKKPEGYKEIILK